MKAQSIKYPTLQKMSLIDLIVAKVESEAHFARLLLTLHSNSAIAEKLRTFLMDETVDTKKALAAMIEFQVDFDPGFKKCVLTAAAKADIDSKPKVEPKAETKGLSQELQTKLEECISGCMSLERLVRQFPMPKDVEIDKHSIYTFLAKHLISHPLDISLIQECCVKSETW